MSKKNDKNKMMIEEDGRIFSGNKIVVKSK
jgi:hypothetical protein